MPINPSDLSASLKAGVKPVYVIGGDEPLLVEECGQQVRETLRERGVAARDVYHVDARFDWKVLTAGSVTQSLFSELKLMDIRLRTGKPGREGAAVLAELGSNPPPDTSILLSGYEWEFSVWKSKWLTTLCAAGVAVRCNKIGEHELPGWIAQRLRAKGFMPGEDACLALAERVEGNLLAAAQEIEKLALLHPPGEVDADTVMSLVADYARFDVFRLSEAVLAGKGRRAVRVLAGLRGEGVVPQLILWALARDARILARLAGARGSKSAVWRGQRIWPQHKNALERAVRRASAARWRGCLKACVEAERIAKGQRQGDPWIAMERLTLAMSGVDLNG